jgi:hypothetical protein
MKTKYYLIIPLILISFWQGMNNVSGNNMHQMEELKIYQLKEEKSENTIRVQKGLIQMNNQLIAKIDTTLDDYIFISARLLAWEQKPDIPNLTSDTKRKDVIGLIDTSKKPFYVIPERA